MYHYSVPPQGYVRYDYTSSSSSPSSSPAPEYQYYIPQQYAYTPTKEKKHSRTMSYGTPKAPGGWHSAEFPSPTYYTKHANFKSPPARHEDYVSRDFERVKVKNRRYTTTAHTHGDGNWGSNGYSSADSRGPQRHASVRATPSKTQPQHQRIIIDTSDSADDSPHFAYIKPRKQEKYHHPAPAQPKYPAKSRKPPPANTDFFYSQAPARPDDSYHKSAAAAGHSRRPSSRHNKPSKPAHVAREATAKDAQKHRIPAGYSLKNWDPDESPVMLLGSVFDANSLGKWIYDWTVFHHGPATPISEVAGDLWLLLIKLAHKMKRADECLPRVEDDDDADMVEDFLDGGDRLWGRFKKLLKDCEEYMWKAAKKEGGKGTIKMGKNSGCEFVDSIFGRDREMEETESLMQSVRLWNMRFDANCEEILRHPRG